MNNFPHAAPLLSPNGELNGLNEFASALPSNNIDNNKQPQQHPFAPASMSMYCEPLARTIKKNNRLI